MMLRYAGVDRDVQLWRYGFALLAVAVTGGLCAVGVHHGCFHPPPPVSVPDPGTPRGDYCSAVIPEDPWILMTVVPCVLAALVCTLSRTERSLWLWTLLICAILVGNAIAANSLNAALTI
jgi:hypothetical protein